MYCPSCGSESREGLNFCKQCGYSLSSAANFPEGKGSFAKFAVLFAVIALVGLIGIIGPFATAQDMAHMHYGGPRAVVPPVLFWSPTPLPPPLLPISPLLLLLAPPNTR